MTNEQKEHIRLWVAALRSGEYAQTTKMLRRGGDFCCLGVACELYRRETKNGQWSDVGRFRTEDGGSSRSSLPLLVMNWFGLPAPSPCAYDGDQFAVMNDAHGADFATIADAIEKTYLEAA